MFPSYVFIIFEAGGVEVLVVDSYSVLQEPVLLLLHPVRLKSLLTDFTRLWKRDGRYYFDGVPELGGFYSGDAAAQTHLSNLVLGGSDALELLLLGSGLALLYLLLVLLLKELTLGSLLQVSDLLKLNPVLNEKHSMIQSSTIDGEGLKSEWINRK